MLKVHHLNNSRSQRILWLLEELDAPYEIVHYTRLSPIPLAPPELKSVHPLGKSPVITDDGETVAESGAIIEYILDKYGKGRLRPAADSADHVRYLEWMHYAEGSAMLPFMLKFYTAMLGDAAAPLRTYFDAEIVKHLSYMETALGERPFFVGADVTGADVQLAFVVEAAEISGVLSEYPGLKNYLARIRERPAYRRAIEKGGPYKLGG